jgi:DNA-binding CsgD family transcriptional regulator
VGREAPWENAPVEVEARQRGERDWQGDWPLVGRGDELDMVREARRSKRARALVLGGAQGVGKSRLAGEALAQARTERWATDRVDGAAATAAVPFAAVAHLAPAAAAAGADSGDPLRLLLSITEQLTRRAARRPLMLLVDDAHELDEASLALLRRVISIPNLFLLVTIRSDEHIAAPIVGLWKDGHADRIEVVSLTREETYRLVVQALGGEVETATLRRLWNHSLGNPLFLRELVLAEGSRGWRRGSDGLWSCSPRGRRLGRRLTEVVQSRLWELDESERSVLEMLTVSGPLHLDQLSDLVPLPAVAAVTARGLAVARDSGHPAARHWDTASPAVVVSLAHPLYGIALADAVSPLRVRELRRRLLDLLEARAAPTPGDAVRIAALRLDHGGEVDTGELVLAAQLVLTSYPRALAERLAMGVDIDVDVEVDEAGVAMAAMAASNRPSPDDVALAARLARTAWESDRSLPAGLAWAASMVMEGQATEAAALITEMESLVIDEWDQTWVALARASLQFWVLDQADEASATLRSAEASILDPRAVRRLRRERAGIALNIGRVQEAIDISTTLIAAADPEEPVVAMAGATAAAALALAGRPCETVALVDRMLPDAQIKVAETPEVLGQMLLARQFAARLLGRLDEAEWVSYACYQAAADNGSLDAMGLYTGALGQIAQDRGRLSMAARRLRESEVLLRERDMFGYRPWVLAYLAIVLAQSGQTDAALETYGLARAASTRARYFDPDIALAGAWCDSAAGRGDAAAKGALSAAEAARRRGLHGLEAAALHTLTRLGRPGSTGDRLAALAASAASPLWQAYADHARATAAEDPVCLDSVSATFEEFGAVLLAAEAAAAAAALHDLRGVRSAGSRAAARSQGLAESCEGASTPALRLGLLGPQLTRREQEVAVLAAEGLSSRTIAERLVVSTRTVESHLYRVFAKLGVTDRTQLADLLGRATHH